jgi:hypothetical protein
MELARAVEALAAVVRSSNLRVDSSRQPGH